jgi:hypothetical protein
MASFPSSADVSGADNVSLEIAEPREVGGEDTADTTVEVGVTAIENTGVVDTEDERDTVAKPLSGVNSLPLVFLILEMTSPR